MEELAELEVVYYSSYALCLVFSLAFCLVFVCLLGVCQIDNFDVPSTLKTGLLRMLFYDF